MTKLMKCEISDGPRNGFKTVGVKSVEGHMEFLAIEEKFLVRQNGDFLLPVFVVGRDKPHEMELVQLPFEADSGARRVWVYSTYLMSKENEVPA